MNIFERLPRIQAPIAIPDGTPGITWYRWFRQLVADLEANLMKYVFVKALAQTGDFHLSADDWATSKALIETVRVITGSADWDLWLLQNDNGIVADDANVPALQLVDAGNGEATVQASQPYEDEDASNEVHFYFVDNAGANTADIYVAGVKLV